MSRSRSWLALEYKIIIHESKQILYANKSNNVKKINIYLIKSGLHLINWASINWYWYRYWYDIDIDIDFDIDIVIDIQILI